ncbi:ATP-binding protein, partial [Gracilibacillus oryzae]|uniref:ATP-binding protein n=1 Tax=Gracilibacillus oryzae TaxID=1672701 RepID=UPI002B1BCEF1
CENSKKQNEHGQELEFECNDCKDTGSIIDRVFDDELGYEKDVYRPCHCQETRNLRNRFKNALIPDEFKKAKFDNYEINSEVQETLYQAILDYLRNIQEIIEEKQEQNSIGFIATMGEARIRSLAPEHRSRAKAEHNSYGLGKTHLQIAAARWIMQKVKVRDQIEMNVKSRNNMLETRSRFKRGCRVLCVSDATFMDDLINAKRMSDDSHTFNKLMLGALKVDVLLWDDLGKSKWSEAKESLYYQIINERYRNNKPIIFSSN